MRALPEQRIIQRWGLLTGRKELTTTLPFGSIHGMAMGSDADEYVLVAGGTQTSSRSRTGLGFLDVQSLRPGKIKISGTTLSSTGRGVHLRASANGMVYGCWTVGVTPSRIGIIVVTGDRAAARRPHWSGGVVLPNPDGSVVFQVNQLYSGSLEPLSESLGRSGKGFFPAVRGSYFLGLVSGPGYATSSWSSQTRGAARLSLFILGHDQPLLTLDPIDVGLGSTPNSSFAAFTADKMYHLIPEAELLILVPPARNRLILKHLGIKAALDNSGVDYLFVTSFPPPSVEKGSVYRYKPATMSRQGGVKYNLASSPEGMRLMEGAEIVWPVPQGFKDSTASVILQVGDKSGREIHHTFTIRVK